MRHYVLLFVIIAISGCSNEAINNDYCNSINSKEITYGLSVRDVYVYGALGHGTILISPSCLRPAFKFYSFQEAVSQEEGAKDRIYNFNKVVYNSPGKSSGLFKLAGVINVYPDSMHVELYDVNYFEEVDEVEAKSVISSFRNSL